ncbi:MAG: DUF4878 domain-containing protein [Bacteroidales bacterium]|nr:DUF4878 domain-containing protein [Bacteroidales bacterium]
MKKLSVILCALVAVFCLASCNSTSTPTGVVKAYHDALSSGDYEKAVTYTTLTSQEDLDGYAKKLKDFEYKVLSYEVLSETISEDGETAVVEVKRTTTNSMNKEPKETTDKVKLSKVDGKWKISI